MQATHWDKLAILSLLVAAPLLVLGILAIIVVDASRSYQSPVSTCLCLDGEPVDVLTNTVYISTTVPVTRFVEVTRGVPVTRYVVTTLPHDAITSELEIMFDGGDVARVSEDDINAMEERGGCYVTDMFPAKLGGLYYHIYVCMMADGPSEEGR